MNRPGILDLEMLLWNEEMFQQNSALYQSLIGPITRLLTQFRKAKTVVLISETLMAEISAGFPLATAEGEHPLFKKIMNTFLRQVRFSNFSFQTDSDLETTPNIKKSHFNEKTNIELDRIIAKVFESGSGSHTFFSFTGIWVGGEDEINIQKATFETVKVEVVVSDKEAALEYFTRKEKVFDKEYEKHHIQNDGLVWTGNRKVSPLSCYAGRNVERCQEVLDGAESDSNPNNKRMYRRFNDKWQVFRPSFGGEPNYRGNNVYHGHDEDDEERIPLEIRKRKEELSYLNDN